MLGQGDESLMTPSTDNAEIAGVPGRVMLGEPLDDPVIERVSKPEEKGRVAAATDAIADVELFRTGFLIKAYQHFDRILEIAVNYTYVVRGGKRKAHRHGSLMAEIAAEPNTGDARLGVMFPFDNSKGIIAAPIIDADDLPRFTNCSVQFRDDGPKKSGQHLFFIKARHYQAKSLAAAGNFRCVHDSTSVRNIARA